MKRAVIRLFGRILSVVGLGASYDTMTTLVFDGPLARRVYAETCKNSNGEVLSYTVESTTQYYKAWQDGELSGPFLEVSETASSSGTWSYQVELSGNGFYVPARSYVILANACNPGVATGYGELWDGSALYSSSASEFESMGCEYVGLSDGGGDVGTGGTGGTGTATASNCYYTEAFVVPTVCYTFDSCAAGATQVASFNGSGITECVTPLIGMREYAGARGCYMNGAGLCERSAPVNETCTGSDYYNVLPFFGATTGAGCYYKSNSSNASGFHIYPVCEYEGGGSSDGECYDVVTGIITCRQMSDSDLTEFFSGTLPVGATIATCWGSGGYSSGYCPNGTGTGGGKGCWYFGDSNCYGDSCAATDYGYCSGVIAKMVLQSLDEAALSSGTGYGTPFYYKSLDLLSATGTGCNQIIYFNNTDTAGVYEYLGLCPGTGAIDTYGGAAGTGVGYTTMGTVRICPDGTSYVVSLEE